MKKSIKILTVCQKGCCRSVGTRYRLNRRRFYNVIAIGATNTDSETLKMLCNWADIILLAEPKYADYLPIEAKNKIENQFTIGPDLWGNALNPDMQNIIKDQLNKLTLR